VNATLVLAALRQRLSSPVRLVLLAFMFFMPLGATALMPLAGFTSLGDGYWLTLVLAAGMIGQDASSGVLQLLFARPVRRSEYVVNRWLAVGMGASVVLLVQAGLGAALLSARGYAPSTHDLAILAGNNVLTAAGIAAVMALFSALLPGFGDLALLLVFNMVAGVMQLIGQVSGRGAISRVGAEIAGFISPRLDLTALVAGTPSWFAIAGYFSTVTLCLALAIVVLNRRELSYASAG
jgi:ABC-type transport system involved in multi-copper enzyme maturation permease subunit